MPRSANLVLTTIFEPSVLNGYLSNFRKFGHLEQVRVILIADRKTPPSAWRLCQEVSAAGLCCSCPSLEEQEAFLRRAGVPAGMIPFDSDNRRNIGYLMALESGADFLMSIDDDNFCLESEDFFAAHAVVCAPPAEHEVAGSATGFLNICELLEYSGTARVYPRGFPYQARHRDENWSVRRAAADIHVNAGLWLIDPDLDAISWLVAPPRVTGFRQRSLALEPGAWSPVNTQNTALRREAIPGYYFIPMGYALAGMPIDRYGDIFSGYFVEACAKHLGGTVRFGTPMAEHRRNSHNYMKDAGREWGCILALEDLLPWLREARLSGDSYGEAYRSLSYLIEDAVESFSGTVWTDATRAYFHRIAYQMRIWLGACTRVLGR
jgi:hypothetical protein